MHHIDTPEQRVSHRSVHTCLSCRSQYLHLFSVLHWINSNNYIWCLERQQRWVDVYIRMYLVSCLACVEAAILDHAFSGSYSEFEINMYLDRVSWTLLRELMAMKHSLLSSEVPSCSRTCQMCCFWQRVELLLKTVGCRIFCSLGLRMRVKRR